MVRFLGEPHQSVLCEHLQVDWQGLERVPAVREIVTFRHTR